MFSTKPPESCSLFAERSTATKVLGSPHRIEPHIRLTLSLECVLFVSAGPDASYEIGGIPRPPFRPLKGRGYLMAVAPKKW